MTEQFDAAFHFPVGAEIPVADLIAEEACYINLDPENRCPKCGASGATMIYADGPVRTHKRLLKVMARAYRCDSCHNGYLAAEVVD